MTTYHHELSQGRWHTMTLAEQMGNIGSEYERALRWKEKNETTYFDNAFARLLELLDLTITDPRWRTHRLKELVRVREEVCSEFFDTGHEAGRLRNYFQGFSLFARRRR